MMIRFFALLLVYPCALTSAWAQTEGPHIWITDSGYTIKSIVDGTLHVDRLHARPADLPHELPVDPTYAFKANGFLAISDIHGQYDLFKRFLYAHGVIDSSGNWCYGTGHLVVLGDIMDRGNGVTEALWLVHKLSHQARQADGRVHYLAGNHELMVLDGDLRYIHEKYTLAASIMGVPYDVLFSPQTVLGRWLARRPAMITINDVLFVHAGISPEFMERRFTIPEVNRLFREEIYPRAEADYRQDSTLRWLATSAGPLWYRGYFRDEPLPESSFRAQLAYFNVNYMVVGHTSFTEIQLRYGGKLFAIDSSIKYGKGGEVLIFSDGKFFRGKPDGTRSPL